MQKHTFSVFSIRNSCLKIVIVHFAYGTCGNFAWGLHCALLPNGDGLDSADTDSRPCMGRFVLDKSHLLPNNPARQWSHCTSVPVETRLSFFLNACLDKNCPPLKIAWWDPANMGVFLYRKLERKAAKLLMTIWFAVFRSVMVSF